MRETFVEAGGLELAKRWLYSQASYKSSYLKTAAVKWFCCNTRRWSDFDPIIKDQILFDFFDRTPSEKYLPSPDKVESLRLDMAGDMVYLERLDEMISRHVKGYPVTSFQPQEHSPNNDEEWITWLMGITEKNGYCSATLPLIFVSSETPPIFVDYPELDEENRDEVLIPKDYPWETPKISIENLLGVYDPQLQQIIIYERGIGRLVRRGFDKKWLFAVVLIHEIGHWITHQLPKPGVPTWRTDLYALSEEEVREGWAQLITWWVADQVGGKFKDTFEKLNKNQPSPYRVFKKFKSKPIDKVMASLEKLRLLQRSACLEDWEKALEE